MATKAVLCRGIGLSQDSSTDPITIESYAESTVDLFSGGPALASVKLGARSACECVHERADSEVRRRLQSANMEC